MRLSQSAPVSSPKGGNGHRLGTRTRKKHKRLDAICEDVFNQNHRDKIESNDGTSKGDSLGNESELRRSSRVRRAPVLLDSSPPPPKKRRKINKIGKKIRGISGKKLRGQGKVEAESNASSSSSENSDDEELGAWGSRLRSRVSKLECSLKRSGAQPRGKRKLFQDVEEDNKQIMSVEDDFVGDKDGENSKVMKCTWPGGVGSLIEYEEKLYDGHLGGGTVESGIEVSRNDDDGDCSLSARETIDGNEDKVDSGPFQLMENDNEAPSDIPVQEKQNMNDYVKDSGKNDESSNSSKSVKDPEDERFEAEIASVHTDPAEKAPLEDDQGCSDEVNVAETDSKDVQRKNEAKVENHNVIVDGFSKPRIKEGRHCGLCGGGIDGKPPKRLANDYAGSDHEAYSGSSASEEFNYDAWDGFGDEPGWLGSLLGPINDRYGIAGIWVHQQCAVWSPEVYFAGPGCLKNVRAALCRGRALKCTRCGRPGATLGCRVDRCPRTYHLPCARASGCIFDHRKFLIACADHRYHFQPHGYQYVQHIKKLKAKKMKLELRRVSNDASRKDIEAEEKWMEKCGEDEEFLRRETKRLQRDLARIAPVYIGGCHSDNENLFDGWESVAGLQDVIKCMKEVVILPLLYPEFFENMGITPPRGVLLHGYPGTGKTLVVRALIGSCSRGAKRIAYFARKGADCLGKYVGDAERQLRLLFQVAERSQPSIIFFDEIDGLAPVRTRQQDQTHSSVVSTLLALMDGLKSRGSVIVIGATNRPDAVDPALRRPGRFDREIYFPLPSVKDRAAILALHTRKWPKPVAGPLLEWVAIKTVGFAGADLQALCAQAAVIALKRNCSWQQILSSAEHDYVEGKRPLLPAFIVEERDWLEAFSLAPPPCSRREAGAAASEVVGTPLHMHLIPGMLQPLLSLIISLYTDDRLWLPPRLLKAGAAVKRVLISLMERKGLPTDRWWFYAPRMAQESSTAREIIRNLSIAGVLDGDASFAGCDFSNDACVNSRSLPCSVDFNPSGLFRNFCYASSKKAGYRILIAGDPSAGQKHLASCLLHCFVGSTEVQKIDLATISQEGHGDMEQGISHILMKFASMKLCAVYMPRVDLWAIQSAWNDIEASSSSGPSVESSLTPTQSGLKECSKSESARAAVFQNEPRNVSQTWKSFVEQLECICVSTSLIILATSELPCTALPWELHQFFGSDPLSEQPVISEHASPRFTVEVKGKFDCGMLIHSAALVLSRDLIQQFIQFVHHKNHTRLDSNIASESHFDIERDESNNKSVGQSGVKNKITENPVTKGPAPLGARTGKGKSTLAFAISTFGYQILTYPHFAELCWVTSKLTEGPSADICGPWKGWPFNSCIVRPCKSMQKEAAVGNSNSIRGKDKFTLVRGLIAVGLSAYRGKYSTPREVSLEVRRVLELLVVQIGVRIQSGKDRYQFIRLLSQVAYLEDLVNNWAHSLRSLEPDSQTSLMSPKLASMQLLDGRQIPADNPVQLAEKSDTQGNGFHEPELMDQWHDGNVTGPPTQDGTVPVGSSSHIAPPKCSGEVANNENTSLEKAVLVNNNPVLVTNSNASAVMIQSRESLRSRPTADFAIFSQQSPQQSDQLACIESPSHLRNDTCNSGELRGIEPHGSHDICDQSNKGEVVENETSAKPRMHISDAHVPDFIIPFKAANVYSESEVVCAYSCCIGCIHTLNQLVMNLITEAWDLSGSSGTVEGAHDLVCSLSATLWSTIRNFCASEGCSSLFNGDPSSDACRKLFEHWQTSICKCGNSESKYTQLTECTCHQTLDFSGKADPSLYNQLSPVPRYIFRDGVLITADPGKELSFHCKYDTLCLCPLIDLIVMTKRLSD